RTQARKASSRRRATRRDRHRRHGRTAPTSASAAERGLPHLNIRHDLPCAERPRNGTDPTTQRPLEGTAQTVLGRIASTPRPAATRRRRLNREASNPRASQKRLSPANPQALPPQLESLNASFVRSVTAGAYTPCALLSGGGAFFPTGLALVPRMKLVELGN